MPKQSYARWLTWPLTALLLVGCVFSPPTPVNAPSLPTEAARTAPVLIPTITPSSEQSNVPSLAQQELLARLPALGAAPELQNEIWFNSDPLQLSALRGKVVMVEFWTYG